MMRKVVYIFFIVAFLWSCTSRTIYKKPKNLIEKEQMIDVWTDLYIASGAKNIKTKKLEKDINYTPLVLEKHNIDSIQFSDSNLYYTSRIEDYEKMFLEVKDRLEKIKNQYAPKNERDSMIELSNERILDEKSRN